MRWLRIGLACSCLAFVCQAPVASATSSATAERKIKDIGAVLDRLHAAAKQ